MIVQPMSLSGGVWATGLCSENLMLHRRCAIRWCPRTHSAVAAVWWIGPPGPDRARPVERSINSRIAVAAWTVRDAKTGARAVPLSPTARQVLTAVPEQPDNPWVISGRGPGTRLANLNSTWGVVRKKAGLEDVRIQDLRHSCASSPYRLASSTPTTDCNIGLFHFHSHRPDSANFTSVYKRSADWTQWRG